MRNNTTTTETDSHDAETSFHNYQVKQVPLHADGYATRFLGNLRTDTNECLGTCTDRYDIVQNETLIGFTETLLKERGLNRWERKEVITHGGAKARFIYKFPDLGIKVAGNDLIFALKVQNSFDGSLRASFNIGLFRLICSNGMTIPHKAINLSHKHTGNIKLRPGVRAYEQNAHPAELRRHHHRQSRHPGRWRSDRTTG